MPKLQKAFIGPYINGHLELDGGFKVPFNPAEISIEEAIGVSDISNVKGAEKMAWMQMGRLMGMQYPVKDAFSDQTKGLTRLSATLFFNTLTDLYQTSYKDVREEIRQLYRYTNNTEKHTRTTGSSKSMKTQTASKTYKAQQIYFFWGTIAVAGMLKQMSVNYTMFAPDGTPVRAQVNITIEGVYVGEEIVMENEPAPKSVGGDSVLTGNLSEWKSSYGSRENPRTYLV